MVSIKPQAKKIRWFRRIHRKISIALMLFFLLIAATGILLGLKKQAGLLAPTQKGESADFSKWLPVDSLHKKAIIYLRDSVSNQLSARLDRIDIRPDKGIAKFIFKDHYWGLQLDCTTGELLLKEKRTSDFIENLHDGSILDKILGTSDEQIKASYMTLTGIGLVVLIISGFWLWFGPKRIRKLKNQGK